MAGVARMPQKGHPREREASWAYMGTRNYCEVHMQLLLDVWQKYP